MSVFKDDMGLGDALQKIQTNNFRIKTEKETKVSDKSSSEIVVKSDEVELSTDAVVRKKIQIKL
ncbi:MAG: hypothetical protein MZV64_27135 [Ignavibacteriales bacterium]|nr:hypothetical protein [Ignavibacteriales bacterium]